MKNSKFCNFVRIVALLISNSIIYEDEFSNFTEKQIEFLKTNFL